MQESDRQMLMEFWLFQLLKGGRRPLCYARAADRQNQALVSFLLPINEYQVNEADCEVVVNPGPPCEVSFEFTLPPQSFHLVVPINQDYGCQPEILIAAAGQVETFWLFISQEDTQAITLYEIAWNPL